MKPPPIRGPMTEARPNTRPKMPWKTGRLWSGTMGIMTIMAPVKMPADPKPAMARPAMKTGEFGAAPQMVEPTSKMMIEPKKTLCAIS